MNQQYPKLKIGINFAILISICIIGFISYSSFQGEYNTTYEYAMPSVVIDAIRPDRIINNAVGIDVFFNSTSLSAQNPIDVVGRAYPTNQFTDVNTLWETLPNNIYLIFTDSLEYPVNRNADAYFEGLIQLNKTDSPMEYVGIGKIIYQFEGDYKYYIMHKDEFDSIASVPGYQFVTDEVLTDERASSIFHVDSSEVTMTLQSNQIFLGITWIVVVFGIIQLHHQIQDSIVWIASSLRRFKKNKS